MVGEYRKNNLLLFLLCIYSATIFMFNGMEDRIRYVYVAYALLMLYLLLHTFTMNNGLLNFTTPCKLMTLYFLFSATSYLWSPMPEETTSRLRAFLLLLVLCLLINNFDNREQIADYLISAIIIGGLCEALFCFQYYGMSFLLGNIGSGLRFEDTAINNVNTLSDTLVVAMTATIATMLMKRKYILAVILVPEFLVLMVFSSRTAMLALIISSVIVLNQYRKANRIDRYPEYRIVLFVITIGFACAIFKLLTGSSMMSSRLNTLLSFFQGNGEGRSNSLSTRTDYIRLGLQQFWNYPIAGRGFACAGYALRSVYGYSTYLHNNFVEILSSGGLIGFGLYYGCYAFLFIRHLRLIRVNPSLVTLISFSTMCCEMLTHIGIVTYYSKVTWFVMALWFVVSGIEYNELGNDELV